MFASAAMLRPGIAVGEYPQKDDIRDGWLDQTAAGVTGFLRQHLHGRNNHFVRFAGEVNRHSENIDSLDEEALRTRVTQLRQRLYSEGLRDELVSQAFGLIREFASRRLGMRHHDVQLFGGRAMLNGMIAEMETGEGKTMTATLPACTAALAGIPVHIVTVNDFLVARDAKWMGPVYHALGLTVGTITEGMGLEQRRAAYACDVTYCTNKQLVFDYLKDSLLLGQENRRLHMQLEGLYKDRPRTSRLLMRGLCFAIVDEADSVLVDEARTPLIISSKGDATQEEFTYKEAIRIARMLRQQRDFTIRVRDKHVDLTDFGKASILYQSRALGGLWAGAKRREELVQQALEAANLLERENIHAEVLDPRTILPLDEDLILQSVEKTGKVVIVHEAPVIGGFGGEIAAILADKGLDFLEAPVKRVGAPFCPVPSSPEMEQFYLPNAENIIQAVLEIV